RSSRLRVFRHRGMNDVAEEMGGPTCSSYEYLFYHVRSLISEEACQSRNRNAANHEVFVVQHCPNVSQFCLQPQRLVSEFLCVAPWLINQSLISTPFFHKASTCG